MSNQKDISLSQNEAIEFNWSTEDDSLKLEGSGIVKTEIKEEEDLSLRVNRSSLSEIEDEEKETGELNLDISPNTIDFPHAIHLAGKYFVQSRERLSYKTWVESIKKILDIGKRYSNPYIPSCEQYRALLTTASRVLVDACPGSGKTATLMNKIFFDGEIRSLNCRQLGVTYTRAASESLLQTYTSICRRYRKQNRVEFGTIHSLAYNVEKWISGCDVLTDQGINKVIQTTYYDDEEFSFGGDEDWDEGEETIFISNRKIIEDAVDTLGFGRVYISHISKIEGWINVIAERMIETQEELLRLEEFNDLEFVKIDDLKSIAELARSIRQTYDVIDFTDMLVNFHNRLKGIDKLEDVKEDSLRISLTYDYIYVDEFQDISPRQWEIISELLRLNPKCNLYCVGDADQAIYSFRGADSKFLVEYLDNVVGKHGMKEEDVDIMYFTINRRSGKDIVDLTSDLIQENKYRYQKSIQSFEGDKESNIKIIADPTKTSITSRTVIMSDIQEMKRREPDRYDFSDVGILYREHQQSFMLLTDMINNKIPINLSSKYFPSNFSEVQDILGIWAMLQDSGNPYRLENYLYKCMNDINKQRATLVASKVRQTGKRFSDFLNTDEVQDLRLIYKDLKEGNMKGAIDKTVHKYYTAYLKLFPLRFWKLDVTKYYLSQWEHLNRQELMSKHEEVLQYMNKNYRNIYGVQFKTMHSSKGLEYEDVYILPIGDSVMPKKKMLDKMSKQHRIGYVEEERRLLYVALSRSRKNLTVFVEKLTDTFPTEVYKSFSKVMLNKPVKELGDFE